MEAATAKTSTAPEQTETAALTKQPSMTCVQHSWIA